MRKMVSCSACGKEIAESAKACPFCGAKHTPPVYKRVWFWVVMIFVVLPVVSAIVSPSITHAPTTNTVTPNHLTTQSAAPDQLAAQSAAPDQSAGESAAPSQAVTTPQPSVFDGDCGFAASAEMGSSIIGMPELSISITNTSGRDIAAIEFYAVPYNVYGEELNNWMTQNRLYTDTAIPAGQSTRIAYPFIDSSVKTVKLYVYSVYFSDGAQWGNKDATVSTILSQSALIEVSGQS